MNPFEALALFARAEFRPLLAQDWELYDDDGSFDLPPPPPMVAKVDEYTLLLYSDQAQIIDPKNNRCWNISLNIVDC